MDHPERDVHLQFVGPDRTVLRAPAAGGRRLTRPADPGAAHRLRIRRVHRGRGGFWRAGGDHRRTDDRPRVPSAGRRPPCLDRQYRPRCLWRVGHAPGDPRAHHQPGPAIAQLDGRAPVAPVFPDRAVLAGGGAMRVARHGGGLAGVPGDRNQLRRPPIRDEQFPWSLAGGHRGGRGIDGGRWWCSCASGVHGTARMPPW